MIAKLIALRELVLRDDLDPRLGVRDADRIRLYADIFDSLPPLAVNQHNEIIDGWHRYFAAERDERTELPCVVTETADDADLADRMWAANRDHGVPYSRAEREAFGLRLHARGLSAENIAERVGVSKATVNRWTADLRREERKLRDERITAHDAEGRSQVEIAEELGVAQRTVSGVLSKKAHLRQIANAEPEAAEPEPENAPTTPTAAADDETPAESPETEHAQTSAQIQPPVPDSEAQSVPDRSPEPISAELSENPSPEAEADSEEAEPEPQEVPCAPTADDAGGTPTEPENGEHAPTLAQDSVTEPERQLSGGEPEEPAAERVLATVWHFELVLRKARKPNDD